MPIDPNPDPWLPTPPIPLDSAATPINVFRQKPDPEGGPDLLELLDNVCVESIQQHQGTDPGTAVFRYKFTENDPDAPQSVEEALDTSIVLPKTVNPGDRLVVMAIRWDDFVAPLFDGFVLNFLGDLAPDQEMVRMVAQGVAKRLWDVPVPGAVMRDADDPAALTDAQTDIAARFNPKGVPNCTIAGQETVIDASRKHSVFIDELVIREPEVRRLWTLPEAVCYLLFTLNPDEEYVTNPDEAHIKAVLVAREPIPGETFDPADPSTYEAKDIIVPDRPITGRDFPTAIHEMIRDKGFGMHYQVTLDDDDNVVTDMKLYVQQSSPPKLLYLQPALSALDLSYSNVTQAHFGRDLGQVVNQWQVNGRLARYECSFVLAPLFPSDPDDASAGNLPLFDRNYIKKVPAYREQYRLYGIDETGDYHYAPGSATRLTTFFDFVDLFGEGKWVVRRRKPLATLISLGPDLKPLRATLSYSYDYSGPAPAYWDSTLAATWKPITTSSWHLENDRVAIWISDDHPNSWNVGVDVDGKHPVKLKGVEDQALPGSTHFKLRLTVVVESDQRSVGFASRRTGSPMPQKITRYVDANERYGFDALDRSSEFNLDLPAATVVKRDDEPLATAEAISYRTATECGILDGQIAIPYFTNYYRIGDRIQSIAGRGIGFRTNIEGPDSAPVYPIVEGIKWDLADGQRTILMLSDEAQNRHFVERKIRK